MCTMSYLKLEYLPKIFGKSKISCISILNHGGRETNFAKNLARGLRGPKVYFCSGMRSKDFTVERWHSRRTEDNFALDTSLIRTWVKTKLAGPLTLLPTLIWYI